MVVKRETVDLESYPDLVVIYLGMKVRAPRGLLTLLNFGPRISRAVSGDPAGLLRHEFLIYSMFPPHLGMRQYWRDFESLEAWARSLPHKGWWQEFVRDTGGTGFWHEAYCMEGGMEAVYLNMDPLGFLSFADGEEVRGSMFSSRRRLRREGAEAEPSPVNERELYGS